MKLTHGAAVLGLSNQFYIFTLCIHIGKNNVDAPKLEKRLH